MDIAIIMPVYNEMDNLPAMLAALEEQVIGSTCRMQVIVVDDGSRDDSREILEVESEKRPWLTVIKNTEKRGMGSALKTGTRYADAAVAVWVMADRSDELEDIWEMKDRIEAGAEMVVASRAAAGGDYGELGGMKALGSRLFSGLARILLSLPVRDSTNAFRAFRRPMLEQLELTRDDFAISLEMVIGAVRAGAKVEEIPTRYHYRKRGVSNFPLFRMGGIYLRLVLRAWLIKLAGGWR